MLAFLVRDGAGGLAGGLAGSLAFAAAALRSGLFEVGFVERLNVFHRKRSFAMILRAGIPPRVRTALSGDALSASPDGPFPA